MSACWPVACLLLCYLTLPAEASSTIASILIGHELDARQREVELCASTLEKT
jgi:hypothetical protein